MNIVQIALMLTLIIFPPSLLSIERSALSSEDQALLNTYLLDDNAAQNKLDILFKKDTITNLFTNPDIDYEQRELKLIEHQFSLIAHKPHICRHDTIPQWVIKSAPLTSSNDQRNKLEPLKTSFTLQRVLHAACIRKVIKKYKLENEIIVPKKKWYHLPNKSWKIHDKNYLVLSEYINLAPTSTCIAITENQVRAILIIILKCGLIDIKPDNLWFTTSGKLALIDTEPRSLKDRLCTPLSEQDALHTQELQTSIKSFSQFCNAPILNQLYNTDPSCWSIFLDI